LCKTICKREEKDGLVVESMKEEGVVGSERLYYREAFGGVYAFSEYIVEIEDLNLLEVSSQTPDLLTRS